MSVNRKLGRSGTEAHQFERTPAGTARRLDGTLPQEHGKPLHGPEIMAFLTGMNWDSDRGSIHRWRKHR